MLKFLESSTQRYFHALPRPASLHSRISSAWESRDMEIDRHMLHIAAYSIMFYDSITSHNARLCCMMLLCHRLKSTYKHHAKHCKKCKKQSRASVVPWATSASKPSAAHSILPLLLASTWSRRIAKLPTVMPRHARVANASSAQCQPVNTGKARLVTLCDEARCLSLGWSHGKVPSIFWAERDAKNRWHHACSSLICLLFAIFRPGGGLQMKQPAKFKRLL